MVDEIYYNRGLSKANLLDYRGAIADYTLAIKLNPKLTEAYLNRGIVKNILKDKNGACLDWSKAGELGYKEAYEIIKKYCN
jgi:tetratricopeptide (TPR) repeat protein